MRTCVRGLGCGACVCVCAQVLVYSRVHVRVGVRGRVRLRVWCGKKISTGKYAPIDPLLTGHGTGACPPLLGVGSALSPRAAAVLSGGTVIAIVTGRSETYAHEACDRTRLSASTTQANTTRHTHNPEELVQIMIYAVWTTRMRACRHFNARGLRWSSLPGCGFNGRHHDGKQPQYSQEVARIIMWGLKCKTARFWSF